MRCYGAGMLTQVFIISVILGWTLRGLGQAIREVCNIALECMELPNLQKSKNLAPSLATKRDPNVHIIRG